MFKDDFAAARARLAAAMDANDRVAGREAVDEMRRLAVELEVEVLGTEGRVTLADELYTSSTWSWTGDV